MKVLFVTGKLAEPSLRRVLAEMPPPFRYDVAVLKITVAALMTTSWIARSLTVPEGTDLVLIPGLCEGETAAVTDRVGVPVEKGPKDLRDIPRYFGRSADAREYGAWDIEIVAEINNAPRLTRDAVRREAERYRASGADLIDIGCTPGLEFPSLGDLVRELVDAGMRVSVDSLDPSEIRAAVEAGAELVLSVNGSNIEVAQALADRGARRAAARRASSSFRTWAADSTRSSRPLPSCRPGACRSSSTRFSSRSAWASWRRSSDTRRRAGGGRPPRC